MEERTETCKYPDLKGDAWCDIENNNSGCDWDGGDCCGSGSWTYECEHIECCLDPNYKETNNESCFELYWKGDGHCDDENNNSGCGWDGGDCCGLDVDTSYCTECACLDQDSGYMHKR